MLGFAGALDPLFARMLPGEPQDASPTGFAGAWRNADDPAAVGNTTLVGVGRVWDAHWRLDRAGWMRANVPYAYLEPAEPLRSQLAEGAAPAVTLTLTVRDDARGWHSVGVVQKPGGADDLQMLHAWFGQGTGAWRTEEVHVPAGLTLDGWLYVSEGVTLREMRIDSVPATAGK